MIIDFTFTRTFSTHNAKMTTHEKIYHELVHSMTENTIYITSNKNQGSVPWTKKLGTMHLVLSMTYKKKEVQLKEM